MDITDTPSILRSNGTQGASLSRLSWSIQPTPSWKIKKPDSDIAELVKFDSIGLDVANMKVGWVKWVGNQPEKLMATIWEEQPKQPTNDWSEVYSLFAYSTKDENTAIFFDATNWGGRRGVQTALNLYLKYCKDHGISIDRGKGDIKNHYPVFYYTGAVPVKDKFGKTLTHEPTFKLHKINNLPPIANGTINAQETTPKATVEVQQNNTVTQLKNVMEL